MAAPESGTIAVLAEKPSVARDIARVLGATSRGDGYLHGNGYVVTWAVGHLAALAEPHEINPEWRLWRRDLLPILPNRWPLVVYEKTKVQFEIVRRASARGARRISAARIRGRRSAGARSPLAADVTAAGRKFLGEPGYGSGRARPRRFYARRQSWRTIFSSEL